MGRPAKPSPVIPTEPGDLEAISNRLENAPVTGSRNYLKILPPKVRRALCGALLAGTPFKELHEEFGIDRKTWQRYRDLLSDYASDLFTARSEAGRKQVERNIQWTLGVAREGVEIARAKREPVQGPDGKPITALNPETGEIEIVYQEKPDLAAMSMFLKDAHAAIDRLGEFHEVTGKGADRANAREMLREEIESREGIEARRLEAQREAQKAQALQGPQGMNVFLIPKLPGVVQFPALAAAAQGKLIEGEKTVIDPDTAAIDELRDAITQED